MKKNVFLMSILLPVFLAITACGSIATASVPSDSVSYELKFLLDSDQVLNQEHQLRDEYRDLLSFGDNTYQASDVIYLETPKRNFINEGWINRFRIKDSNKKKQKAKKIERTYKKRYEISGSGLEGIQSALARATADGFRPSEDEDKWEVDWGYSKMTLSISYSSSKKYNKYAQLSQFTTQDAILFAEKGMPDEDVGWKSGQWGVTKLQKAKIVGPLTFYRLDGGNWEDIDGIRVEIWSVASSTHTDYLTELSVKVKPGKDESAADVFQRAETIRTRMTGFLDQEGILMHRDSLKTTAILDAYLPSAK
ncbi:MAG: hypothetical protein IJT34_00135 [Butyrivibrio sp.]|nr:hypothetical protein [Butyrivibrio sp.]